MEDEYTMSFGHDGVNYLTIKFESAEAFWAEYKGMVQASYDWKKKQKEQNEDSE